MYCVKHRFPLLWELEPGVAWFEIPKNGSFSVKEKYPKRILISGDAYSDQYSLDRDARCIVVLRDPVDRFLSMYRHYFMATGARFKAGARFMGRINLIGGDRLQSVIDNLHELSTAEEVHHFRPQCSFVDRVAHYRYQLIGMSGLSKLLGVDRLNTTDGASATISSDQVAQIKTIYRSDYEFFDEFNFSA